MKNSPEERLSSSDVGPPIHVLYQDDAYTVQVTTKGEITCIYRYPNNQNVKGIIVTQNEVPYEVIRRVEKVLMKRGVLKFNLDLHEEEH